ncbi:MAG: thiamine diphosphokinase, partial [Erysipelotrichaceae bacterium]|nr:thiamine diphosphokinase [Erysipelotrichaceae bacterium]
MVKTAVLVCTLADAIPRMKADYFGVDKGALLLAQQKVMMEASIGDFDSVVQEDLLLIKRYSCRMIGLNPIKDDSDSEHAVKYVLDQGYERVILTGVLGGRADHHYVNLQLLRKYPKVEIIEKSNSLKSYPRGIYTFDKGYYDYISFFALEDSVISLKGMKYELKNQVLTGEDLFGLSNEIESEQGI